MAERLTPPVRRNDSGGRSSRGKENKVIKPKKSFGAIRKNDVFVTGSIDIPFFALTMALLAVGLVMLFSASYPYSYYYKGNSYYYFIRQFIFAIVGIVALLVVSKVNYKWFKALSPYLFGVAVFLLVLVLFYHTNVSTSAGESFKRYMKIPGTPFTFQPSDVAKFVLIVALSTYICNYASKMKTFKFGILYPLLVIGLFCGLIILENHMSGAILVFLIGAVLMFCGGSDKRLFYVGIGIVAAVVIVVIANPDFLADYAGLRIKAWLDKDYDPGGARWQTNNSLYAIGSGGLFGTGLGNSKQKYLYVSEPQNDFIFPIVCEELGFVGATIIIVLFALLILRGFKIALASEDKFATLVVIGIMSKLGIQVAFNILVVTDTFPNTGIALPFFSYGGTALMMQLFEMGVVLGISRKSSQKKV